MPVMSVRKAAHACCPEVLKPTLARIEASEIGYRLAKGTFWSVAGAVISRGLGIASSIVVARTLGRSGFGELGIINSTVALFQLFAGFGLGLTATKYVAQYRKSDPGRAGRIIGLSWMVTAVTGGLCAILLAVLAPWLAAHALAAPHLSGLLRITAIGVFITALNAAQNGALSGFEAFRAIATRNAVAGVLNFPVMVTGVLLAGLKGAVWATVISCVINWLVCHLAVRHEARRYGVPLTLVGCWAEMPLLWKFSLPAVLSSMMVAPVTWICNAMLVNQPNGYGQMGIWSAASSFRNILYFVTATAGAPLLPILASMSRTSNDRLERVNMVSTWALGTLAALPLLCFPEAAEVLYGKQFGGPEFRLTFVLILFFTCVVIYKQGLARVLQVHNLMWWGLLSNGFWGLLLIAGTYLLARWGAVGLAISFAIAYTISTVVFIPLYTLRKLVPRNTIVSWEAILIWAAVLFIVLLCYLNVSIYMRSLFFPIALVLVGGAFLRLVRTKSVANA
jgi:O-antigen/teichoic acid export membrane protein